MFDQPNGVTIPLDEKTGIDILGNIMESSAISVNRAYYGNFHNMGHVFISYSHDPDHHHLVTLLCKKYIILFNFNIIDRSLTSL